QARLRQPIWGWFGQRDQFAMAAGYDPVETIDRFTVGTPPVLGGYAVLEGATITATAGIDAIAAKGAALTSYAIELFDSWLVGHDLPPATPPPPGRRGAPCSPPHPTPPQLLPR